MTDFLLVAWVSAMIELRRFGWMFGLGQALDSGRTVEALIRRLQRHAQYRAAMCAFRKRCGRFATYLARKMSISA